MRRAIATNLGLAVVHVVLDQPGERLLAVLQNAALGALALQREIRLQVTKKGKVWCACPQA